MQGIIDDFEKLRLSLEKLAKEGVAVPRNQVRLRPPLPRPSNRRPPTYNVAVASSSKRTPPRGDTLVRADGQQGSGRT